MPKNTTTNDQTPAGNNDLSLQGILISNGGLVVLAVLPIVIGAIRSVKQQQQLKDHNAQKIERKNTGGTDSPNSSSSSGSRSQIDSVFLISMTDAIKIPFIASGVLFGMYVLFKIFSKEYIGPLISCYFCVLGVLALSQLISPLGNRCVPHFIRSEPYHLILIKGERMFFMLKYMYYLFSFMYLALGNHYIIDYLFTTLDVVWLIVSAGIGIWYLVTKHWIANNIFAIAFAVEGIELLHLNNMSISCVVLSGLFFYDIFWVFGTDVMWSVAINLQGMLLLKFPMDLMTNGWNASRFAMLGIGDIVVPGMFIAMLFRFDHSLKTNKNAYFVVTLCGYMLGLVTAFFMKWKFSHSQPALLYLVPLVLGSALALALLRNEVKLLFA